MKIEIKVENKRPIVSGSPVIICGNNDYTIGFIFDEEWSEYEVKTARFSYTRNGESLYEDKVFTGTECEIPVLYDIFEVRIGVYAGDIRTTTPAYIPCEKSITCSGGTHEEPDEDVYNQILDLCNEAVSTSRKISSTGMKTDQGGIVFNDIENNVALAEDTVAFGENTRAGACGYKVLAVEIANDKTYVSVTVNDKDLEDSKKALAFIANEGLGAVVNFEGDHHFTSVYKIMSGGLGVDGNTVIGLARIDGGLVDDTFTLKDSTDEADNWLWFPDFLNRGVPMATSSHAFVGGKDSEAIGYNAISIGHQNKAHAWYSTALGYLNKVFGYGGFAVGAKNFVRDEYGCAIGQNNIADKASLAVGSSCEATGWYSIALGRLAKALKTFSIALGIGTESHIQGQTVIGRYNKKVTSGDPLFTVGNGTSDTNRSDAFNVFGDGSATLQKQGSTDDSIVIKSYADSEKDKTVKEFSNINYGVENYFMACFIPTKKNAEYDYHKIATTAVDSPRVTPEGIPQLTDFTFQFDATVYNTTVGSDGPRPYFLVNSNSSKKIQLYSVDSYLALFYSNGAFLDGTKYNRRRQFGISENIKIRCYVNSNNTTTIDVYVNGTLGISYTLDEIYYSYIDFKFERTLATMDNIIIVNGELDESKFIVNREYVDNRIKELEIKISELSAKIG